MPRLGASTEFTRQREDEMAKLITACDHVDRLRVFARVLCDRRLMTMATYRDYRDSLDCIADALLIARRNTAARREEAV